MILDRTEDRREHEVGLAFELFRLAEYNSRYNGKIANRVRKRNRFWQGLGGALGTLALISQSSAVESGFRRSPWLDPLIILVGALGALTAALFPLLASSSAQSRAEALAKEYGRIAALLRDLIYNLGRSEMSDDGPAAEELGLRAKLLSELLSRLRDSDDLDPNPRIEREVSEYVKGAFPPSLAWRWYGRWPDEIEPDETSRPDGRPTFASQLPKWLRFGNPQR